MTLLNSPVLAGNASERPTTGSFPGQHFVAIDTGAASVWNGSSWVASGGGGGGGWTTRQTATLEAFYPRNANAVSFSTAGAAWAWPANYTQVVAAASMTANFIPHALHLLLFAQPKSNQFLRAFYELELAKGEAGSEVALASCAGNIVATVADFVGGSTIIGTGFTLPIAPDLVPSGTRLAVRARVSLADTDMTMNFRAYVAGYDADAPAADTTYPLDAHLDGTHNAIQKLTPSGSTTDVTAGASWAFGSWVQFIASAANPLLLLGVVAGDSTSTSQNGHYLQFGIGAQGAEAAYGAVAVPGRALLNGDIQLLRRPILVQAGERVALRAASTAAVAIPHQLIYAELVP